MGPIPKSPEGTCSRARLCAGAAIPLLAVASKDRVANKDRVALEPSSEGLELKSLRHPPKHCNACNSEPQHPESGSALVSTKQSQEQEKWCNFTRWAFCTAGSDLITKTSENEHCNSADNTGLSPSKLAFSSAAMSHLEKQCWWHRIASCFYR